MKENSLGFVLIPLAAALALLWPMANSSSRTPSATVLSANAENAASAMPSPSPKPKARHSGTAERQLCLFFGLEAAQCSLLNLRKHAASFSSPTPCGAARSPAPGEYEWEFLIATLPDPRDSRFGYLFDRNLDAMQRAVEAAGYVLARFDLPWQERGGKKETAAETADGTAATGARYQREPGIVLFHDSDNCDHEKPARNKLLVLFLVGESPTAGINQAVLTDALRQVESLAAWSETSERKVKLMAPVFSGSQDSLAFALRGWLAAFPDLNRLPTPVVISGSAMAVDQKKFARRLTEWLPDDAPAKKNPQQFAAFHSTVLPSDVTTQTALDYFAGLESRTAKTEVFNVALLTEGNTAFGNAVREQFTSPTPMPAGMPTPTPSPTPSYRVLKLPFPLHISQLRSATEKAKNNSAPANPGMDLRAAQRPLLPLLLEENYESVDAVPLFTQLENASAELVLSNLLDEINRERVRYVGVIATDVKDVIFLVSQIRRHCPNTVPFTLLSDLLYLRPEVNTDLAGTLVVSPYPLFVQNQLWSAPFDGATNRLQFPSHIAQGAYNATLALLGLPEKMREYGYPFDLAHAANAPRQPGLWISVVGRNNLWPVQAVIRDNAKSYAYAAPPTVPMPGKLAIKFRSGFDSKLSISLILMMGLLGTLVVLSALAQLINTEFRERQPLGNRPSHPDANLIWRILRRARFLGLSFIENSWFGETFGDPVFREKHQFERRVYLFICCGCLLTLYFLFLWIVVIPSWITQFSFLHQFLQWLPASWFPESVNYQRLPVQWESSYRWLRVLFLILTILAFVPTVWLWSSLCDWCYWLVRSKWRPASAPSDQAIELLPTPSPALLSIEPTAGLKQLWRNFSALLPHWFGVLIGLLTTYFSIRLGYNLLLARPPMEHLFFFQRASDLASGVSPLLPLVLVGCAAFLWAFCELRRLSLVERLPDNVRKAVLFLNFDDGQTSSFSGLRRLERQVLHLAKNHIFALPAKWLVIGGIVAPAIYVWSRHIPSIEGFTFDFGFALAFLVVSLAQGFSFARFVFLWVALRRLLKRLSHHPLFSQPLRGDQKERFAGLPKLNLIAPLPNYLPLAFSLQEAGKIYRLSAVEPPAALVNAEKTLQQALAAKADNRWREALRGRCKAQAGLADVSQLVVQMLEARWQVMKSAGQAAAEKTGDAAAWASQAEFYLASCVAGFLHQMLAHIQNLAVFLTTSLILLLMAITSYPFQPRELFLLFGWLLILTVVAAMLVVFAQMSRDKVLSELSGTMPDQVSWGRDFLLRFALHGLLPILALLGAQFPEVIRQWFTWLSRLQGGQ